MDESKQLHTDNPIQYSLIEDPIEVDENRALLRTNIDNSSHILDKYRSLLVAPVYYAAIVLLPQTKWEYFQDHLSNPEYNSAITIVQRLWDNQYKEKEVDLSPTPSSTAPTKKSFLQDHMRRRVNLAPRLKDEYDTYCAQPVVDMEPGQHLEWWFQHKKEFPRLSQMAPDIFSIPGMSAEVERLFSSAKLMLPPSRNNLKEDGIEAGECLRSWVKGGLVLGEYFEYLNVILKGQEGYCRWEDPLWLKH